MGDISAHHTLPHPCLAGELVCRVESETDATAGDQWGCAGLESNGPLDRASRGSVRLPYPKGCVWGGLGQVPDRAPIRQQSYERCVGRGMRCTERLTRGPGGPWTRAATLVRAFGRGRRCTWGSPIGLVHV